MPFVSYAQNFEDVMLWRALREVERGFYIDVGAQDPNVDSVTRAFYDRGWSGINVEPVASYHELLTRARPRDINLQLVAGDGSAELDFYEITDTGLSTLDAGIAARHRDAGWNVVARRVPQRRLADIWAEHVAGEVHFLKVDAEGAEAAVLAGASLDKCHPWIVVVEAVAPLSQSPQHQLWEHFLSGAGYTFAYFDGLNRFYVSPTRKQLISSFASPPNLFDDFVRAREFDAVQRLAEAGAAPAPAAASEDLAARVVRIDATVTAMASTLQTVLQMSGAQRDIFFAQAAYLGDHRALTYIQSGQKIFVDTRSVDIGAHLLLGGMWEANYAYAFGRLLKPGDTVLDIGANHGFYALIAASRIAPGGHVYAFEPSRNFYELIRASVAVNGLGDVVSVENVALGDREGEVTLTYQPGWTGGANIGASAPPAAGSGLESEAVRCVVLDSYLGHKLAKVDVIKMDIEGAEGIALKGMSGIVDRSPDLKMMMEFCPAMLSRFHCDATFVVDFLRGRGFFAWTIDDEGGLEPVRWEKLLEDRDAIRNIVVARRAPA
jgi:FkbM family methyltransferase